MEDEDEGKNIFLLCWLSNWWTWVYVFVRKTSMWWYFDWSSRLFWGEMMSILGDLIGRLIRRKTEEMDEWTKEMWWENDDVLKESTESPKNDHRFKGNLKGFHFQKAELKKSCKNTRFRNVGLQFYKTVTRVTRGGMSIVILFSFLSWNTVTTKVEVLSVSNLSYNMRNSIK